jgi:hypothetical protein
MPWGSPQSGCCQPSPPTWTVESSATSSHHCFPPRTASATRAPACLPAAPSAMEWAASRRWHGVRAASKCCRPDALQYMRSHAANQRAGVSRGRHDLSNRPLSHFALTRAVTRKIDDLLPRHAGRRRRRRCAGQAMERSWPRGQRRSPRRQRRAGGVDWRRRRRCQRTCRQQVHAREYVSRSHTACARMRCGVLGAVADDGPFSTIKKAFGHTAKLGGGAGSGSRR